MHLRVSRYDMPWDAHVEGGLHQQHCMKHLSQFQRVIGDQVRRVSVWKISDVSMPSWISIMIWPKNIGFSTSLGYLVEGTRNAR